jgi:hypothetical protein
MSKKVVFFVLIFFNSFLQNTFGQLVVENGQVFTITEGAILTVGSNIVNKGAFINNGTVNLQGDWQNLNIYNAGIGTLKLTGSQQNLYNNAQPIYKLILNNQSTLLESDLEIENEIAFTSGIMSPAGNIQLRVLDNAKVTGGSDFSFYQGRFFQSGTGYKFFPIGVNGTYSPLELLEVTGINPVLAAEVNEGNFNFTPGNRMRSISNVRVWRLQNISGNYQGSPVTLKLHEDENFEELIGVVVSESDGLDLGFNSLGQGLVIGDINDGVITSRDISRKEYLALGITNEFSLEGEVLVPSAFAPNGSNPADHRLRIFAKNINEENFILRIYNKWGVIVYETSNAYDAIEVGWDGSNYRSGNNEVFGVYRYVVQGKFNSGKSFEKTGSITLFR